MLRDVGNLLVDVNNQNSSQTIRESSMQTKLLDRIAGSSDQVASFGAKLSRMQRLENQVFRHSPSFLYCVSRVL